MSIAQTFGDTIRTLKGDNIANIIPATTTEILTNVLGNLQTNNSTQNNNQPSQTNNQQPQTNNQQSQNIITKPTFWKILKITFILLISFLILSK